MRPAFQISLSDRAYSICGGWTENCPSKILGFEYLVSSWWNCLGRSRRCGLAEGNVSLGTGSESLRLLKFLVYSLCFVCSVLWGYEIPASCSGYHTCFLPCLPTLMDSYLSRTVSPDKPFLLCAALVTAFYHSGRKVMNTTRGLTSPYILKASKLGELVQLVKCCLLCKHRSEFTSLAHTHIKKKIS